MKINIVDEILKHDDHEIIDFLADEMSSVRSAYNQALKEKDQNYLFEVSANVETAYRVLVALNRRNKERGLQ